MEASQHWLDSKLLYVYVIYVYTDGQSMCSISLMMHAGVKAAMTPMLPAGVMRFSHLGFEIRQQLQKRLIVVYIL